jgi:alkyl sulfatase BDS1-like metallo-beta-lactamase superfamily hydrolase
MATQTMTTGLFFDYLGIRVDAIKAEGKHIVLNWTLDDMDSS